jgi:hypothetical protein
VLCSSELAVSPPTSGSFPEERPADQKLCRKYVVDNLASHLDDNVSRSPANGGGGVQGPDCFLTFCLRVLDVKSGGPFFKYWFLCAMDAIGPPCKLYPPRVD